MWLHPSWNCNGFSFFLDLLKPPQLLWNGFVYIALANCPQDPAMDHGCGSQVLSIHESVWCRLYDILYTAHVTHIWWVKFCAKFFSHIILLKSQSLTTLGTNELNQRAISVPHFQILDAALMLCQHLATTAIGVWLGLLVGCHMMTPRGHSVYAPSQWETALQCNAVSHWLGPYTEWSLCQKDHWSFPLLGNFAKSSAFSGQLLEKKICCRFYIMKAED